MEKTKIKIGSAMAVRGHSDATLAAALMVQPKHLKAVRRGFRKPTEEFVRALAQQLGHNPHELVIDDLANSPRKDRRTGQSQADTGSPRRYKKAGDSLASPAPQQKPVKPAIPVILSGTDEDANKFATEVVERVLADRKVSTGLRDQLLKRAKGWFWLNESQDWTVSHLQGTTSREIDTDITATELERRQREAEDLKVIADLERPLEIPDIHDLEPVIDEPKAA